MRKLLGILAIIGIGAFFYGEYKKVKKNETKIKK